MNNRLNKVVLVDDNIANLASGKNALSKDYEVFTTPSGDKLFHILERITPDIILLDIEMPDMDGYTVLKILKENPQTTEIPVIFLTGKFDDTSELKGLSMGAVDYITKPFSPLLLQKRVENHLLTALQKKELIAQKRKIQDYNDNLQKMVEVKSQKLIDLQAAIFKLLAGIVEYRDDETGSHIHRTQRYLQILFDGMKAYQVYQDEVTAWNTDLVILSSQFHDLGKIAIPDRILLKENKLTTEEFSEMQKHTEIGIQIIEKIENDAQEEQELIHHAKLMASTHHEKWDGSGYPNGLAGLNIPLQGRLMAIVDVYDALMSKRPYKEPFTHEETIRIITEGAGKHFDPILIEVFLKISDEFENAAEKINNQQLD